MAERFEYTARRICDANIQRALVHMVNLYSPPLKALSNVLHRPEKLENAAFVLRIRLPSSVVWRENGVFRNNNSNIFYLNSVGLKANVAYRAV